MLASQYAFLVEDGNPVILRQSDTAEQRILVVDLMNDGQVHAIMQQEANDLVAAGRLRA